MSESTTVVQDTLESVDDFLPMPGADEVVSSNDTPKPNVFSRNAPPVDMSFIEDKPEDKKEEEPEKKEDQPEDKTKEEPSITEEDKKVTDDAISQLDDELNPEADPEDRKKPSKNVSMVSAVNALIKDGILEPFEGDTPVEEYSEKDLKELIKLNIEEREKAIKEQTPKEFFEALPEELKYAAMHVAKGNTDLKSVFKALAQREEVRELDASNENHHEIIARQYLQATQFGSGDNDLLEDQINEWKETGVLDKKAKQFKPKLDKMQEKVLEAQLAQQEEAQQRQQEQKDAYMKNIYDTLKPADLNGLKLSNKRQNFLWNVLTTTQYQSMSGRPTNLLGKLLEDYQFGEEPRYDLIAEVTWLLSDPDDYKEQIRKQASNETVQDTVKKLKTEESRKLKSTTSEKEEEDTGTVKKKKAGIKRPQNIFKRT